MTDKPTPPKGWTKGKSGNPNGRPKGTGINQRIRDAIGDDIHAVIAAIKAKALEGDVGAARLLLERTIPPLKAMEQPQEMTIPEEGTLTDQGRAVLQAVALGELAPSQGAALMGAIGSMARLAEVDELASRVAALEAGQSRSVAGS